MSTNSPTLYAAVSRLGGSLVYLGPDKARAAWWVAESTGNHYEVFEVAARPWTVSPPAENALILGEKDDA